jgi:hypothetical protein
MSDLNDDEILAFTKILQDSLIIKGDIEGAKCDGNCGCNEVCGCKKEACCEAKCQCNEKDKLSAEELMDNPQYRDLIKQFDASKLKTFKDFQDFVDTVRQTLKK